MKRLKHFNLILIAAMAMISSVVWGQEKYYQLDNLKEINTTPTKEMKRIGTCWSNAGAAFLEAEWIRTGKKPVELSVLDFVHNLYMTKASVYLNSNDKLRIDPMGMAYDVTTLVNEYGMVPESAYMYPPEEMASREKQGEMDAILRGTLNMIKQKGESFTERWQNMYNTSLLRYMGESKIEFSYNGSTFTPETFATASGLSMEDYIMLTADPSTEPNIKIKPGLKQNWAGYDFYNIPFESLGDAIKNNIDEGYTVIWYGHIENSQILTGEDMAIVPAGEMPGSEEAAEGEENEEPEYKPLEEQSITADMRSEVYEDALNRDQDYLLIYGLKTDQDGNEYFSGKYVCKAGNKTLNLSVPFVELNTVYLMVNKNGLPNDIKGKFGL